MTPGASAPTGVTIDTTRTVRAEPAKKQLFATGRVSSTGSVVNTPNVTPPRRTPDMATNPAVKTTTKPLSKLKEEICDIGRRIYNKGFAAGNDGNISFRLGPNEVLCTPTMISKGFMKPSDLCIVDMEGNQIAGERKRSSEILLHLTIMKERPDVNSVFT